MKNYSVYNPYEVAFKEAYGKFKRVVLFPLVFLFTRLKISANTVSFLGFVTALWFFVQLTVFGATDCILVPFILYLLWDNLDGSIAEKAGINERGQYVDNFFDQTSLLLLMLGMAAAGEFSGLKGMVFVLLYWVIIWGGCISNLNGLRVLILRLRIFPFVFFGINILAGKRVISQPVFLDILILLEMVSAATIVWALLRHRKRVTFPPVLMEAFREIRITGTLSLVLMTLCFLYFLIVF